MKDIVLLIYRLVQLAVFGFGLYGIVVAWDDSFASQEERAFVGLLFLIALYFFFRQLLKSPFKE